MTWEILEVKSEKLYSGDKSNRKVAYVKCDCGKIERRRLDQVISKRTTVCKVCSSKRTSSKYSPPFVYKGIGGFSKTHYNSLKRNARIRNFVWDVSMTDLWNLWIKQNGKCALTGVDLVLEAALLNQRVNWSIVTASLDRINSKIGYVIDNIQWVHKIVNKLKNSFSESEFLHWCSLVVNHANHELSLAEDLYSQESATTRE